MNSVIPLSILITTDNISLQAKSVQELVSLSEQQDFLGTPINFSKLFRPIRLLNALRQVTARCATFYTFWCLNHLTFIVYCSWQLMLICRAKGCTMDTLRLSSAWDSSKFADHVVIHVQVKTFVVRFTAQRRDFAVMSPLFSLIMHVPSESRDDRR